MVGTASTLKSASRFSRGKWASAIRRARRVAVRVVDLGGEYFGEKPEVGLAFPDGDLRKPARLPSRTVGKCSSRAAAPIAACAAASTVRVLMTCSAAGEQLVVADQRRSGPVVTGQGPDRDDRRDLGAGVAPGVDQHQLRVQGCWMLTARSIAAISAAAGMVRCASSTSISARVPAASPRAGAGGVPKLLMRRR